MEEFPLSEFKELGDGMFCTSCVSGESLEQVKKQLAKKTQEVTRELTGITNPDHLAGELPRVKAIISSVYERFGGPNSYATHLYWTIMELSKRKPMPTAVPQLMMNLMKLHHTIEQTEETITAREMTETQLAKETEMAMMKLIVESSNDEAKMKTLKQLLGKHGFKLEEASDADRIEILAEEVGVKVTREDVLGKTDSDIEKELEELKKMEEEHEQQAEDS